MIEFDKVTIEAGGTRILKEVSFCVHEGEKLVITGPTGCGKSTVLTTLLGAYRSAGGAVRYRGRSLDPSSIHEVRREVAYVGQEPVLGDGSVREALEIPFTFETNRRKRPTDGDIAEAIAAVALDPAILDSSTGDISGGEKQRVAIARALLLQRNVFVLDEPTSALDSDTADIVLRRLLRDGATVLAVSHDPRHVELFSRVLRMEGGRIIEDRSIHGGGPPACTDGQGGTDEGRP